MSINARNAIRLVCGEEITEVTVDGETLLFVLYAGRKLVFMDTGQFLAAGTGEDDWENRADMITARYKIEKAVSEIYDLLFPDKAGRKMNLRKR